MIPQDRHEESVHEQIPHGHPVYHAQVVARVRAAHSADLLPMENAGAASRSRIEWSRTSSPSRRSRHFSRSGRNSPGRVGSAAPGRLRWRRPRRAWSADRSRVDQVDAVGNDHPTTWPRTCMARTCISLRRWTSSANRVAGTSERTSRVCSTIKQQFTLVRSHLGIHMQYWWAFVGNLDGITCSARGHIGHLTKSLPALISPSQ